MDLGLTSSIGTAAVLDAGIEMLPEVLTITLPGQRLAELNPSGLLLGIGSPKDMLSGSPLLHLGPNDVPQFKSQFREVVPGDASEKVAPLFLVEALDGKRRAVECRMAPLKKGDGQLADVIVTARNVSQPAKPWPKVKESEALLSAILQTAPDPIIVIEENSLIMSFSKAAEKLFGYLEDEVLGHSIEMVMPERYRQAHGSYIRRFIQTDENRIIGSGLILEGQKKDGSLFPMELVLGELQSSRHRLFAGFIRDITEKFQAEVKMADIQTELIHTSRLSAVGTLASALAHEINQPLTAIANYLSASHDLLDGMKPEITEAISEALNESAQAALRAGQIVRRVSDFVSKGEIQRQISPLVKLIQDSTTLGLVSAREKGISWSVDIEPHIGNVFADRVQIQQVMVNLICNAVEAMQFSTTKHLAIHARRSGKDYAEISVVDTGRGVTEIMQGQLFEPFISTKAQGMGLGLSICQTIVKAHGGQMSVETAQSGGAIFKFTLPLASLEMLNE